MSWIAGIDYSTKAIDVVLIDEEDQIAPRWHRYKMNGANAFDRTRDVALWELPDRDDILAVGIEEPAGKLTGRLFRVQGAILVRLPQDTLVRRLMPSQWRKIVGLPGNASKGNVKAHARHRLVRLHSTFKTPRQAAYRLTYPRWIDEWSDDAMDAYCIARATRAMIDRNEVAA